MCRSAYLDKSAHNRVDIVKSVLPAIDAVLYYILSDTFTTVQKYITNGMDNTDTRTQDFMEMVISRGCILCALQEHGDMSLADLNSTLGDPRRSLDRWLDELAAHDLVHNDGTAYELTLLGKMATDLFREQRETYATLIEAQDLLARLPAGTDIGCAMMDGVDITIEPPKTPESAWQPVDQAVDAGDSVVGIAPRVTRSYIDTFYTQIVEKDTEVELLLPRDVYASIVNSYEREWRSAIVAKNCWFGSVESVPPFGMLIIDSEEVWIGVYRDLESGSALAGTLYNDSPEAVAWAIDLYKRYRADANDVIPLD